MTSPAVENIRLWRADPVQFVRDLFRVEPDWWQQDALRAAASREWNRISLQACAGPGKSAVLAWIGWWFLLCFAEKGHHPNAAAMSVSRDNLRDNLWKELSIWRGRSTILHEAFEQTAERIFARDHPDTWFLSARSWSKTADPEEQGRTLSGLHAKFILYLIDESGGINPAVLRSAEQGLSNCLWGKIAQAGNPTTKDGMLYLAATSQRHLWYVVTITGDPDDPKRSPRIDVEWAREQIALHGRDDPWVMAYILGQFPPTSINALISPDEVDASMKRGLQEHEFAFSQKRIGVDVARFGDDRTILAPRQGLRAFRMAEMRGARTHEIAARVAAAKARWGSEGEYVDDTGGWGAGVIDALIQAGHSPFPVNASSSATDPRHFNKRSECWWLMAEWVKRGGALPQDPQLARELTTPTYSLFKGRLRLEEKDQIKRRLGFSPDKADALALTFAMPDMPGGMLSQELHAAGATRPKEETGYNPLDPSIWKPK